MACKPAANGRSLHRDTSSQAAKLPSVVEGTFRRAMGGFGFVRLTQGVPGAETLDDVFIPPGRTGGALEGDTVRVRIDSRSELASDGVEGSIEEVLKRGRVNLPEPLNFAVVNRCSSGWTAL